MNIVERIKLKCTELNTTMGTLEKELGLGNGTIRRWNEKEPGANRVELIAKRLGVSTDWLITGKETADLTPEEQDLLNDFRGTNQEGKNKDLIFCKDMRKIYPAAPEGVSISRSGKTGTND